jgi:plastocyanin
MKPILASVAIALACAGGQAATAADPGPAQASRTRTVEITGFEYHPPALAVPKGTTVAFSNSARVAHTATDRGVFDSGRIRPGRSFSVRFTRRGTFAYHCKIHRFMRGTVVVR